MNNPASKNDVASPISTGGAGAQFEARVGACYLTALLVEASTRGLEQGTINELRSQRRFEGQPLDDLVICVDLPSGDAILALQVKRDLTFGEENDTFNDVMQDAWNTFNDNSFRSGVDRIGFVVALYSKNIDEHYLTALTSARTSATAADFLKRIATRKLVSETQRSFVRLIRTKLDKHASRSISDDELWRFLRSLVIIHFDVANPGGRDENHAIESLKRILPTGDHPRARDLFNELVNISGIGNWTAGSFNGPSLRETLVSSGWALDAPPSCRPDLRRLNEHAAFILEGIRDDIDGVRLPREKVLADIEQKMVEATFVELIGPAGSGKSSALKSLMSRQASKGPSLILSGERVSGTGWNEFASHLGLQRPLRDILSAIATGPAPYLFIDGIDKAVKSGQQTIINDLLRAAATVSRETGGAIRWNVVASLRADNLREVHSWLDFQTVGTPASVVIPDLSDEELEALREESPRIATLHGFGTLNDIISNPFFLNVLIDERFKLSSEPNSGPMTEIDVAEIWWERIVGAGGADGRARQQSLLQIGRRDAETPGSALAANDVDPASLYSLESDGILRREAKRDLYRFGHDILEDWAIWRVLDQKRESLPAFLLELNQPLALLRPVQLVGTAVLERCDDDGEWARMIRAVEANPELSPRWRQTLLTSPLKSPISRKLLAANEPFLLEQEGMRLRDLVIAARTVEVNPDPSWLPAAKLLAGSKSEIVELLLQNPLPRWREWLPLMDRLVALGDRIPYLIRPEVAKAFEIWQRATKAGVPYREPIARLSLQWLKEEED